LTSLDAKMEKLIKIFEGKSENEPTPAKTAVKAEKPVAVKPVAEKAVAAKAVKKKQPKADSSEPKSKKAKKSK
jgi:hypothetical protein